MKQHILIFALAFVAVAMLLGVRAGMSQVGAPQTTHAQGKGCVGPGKQDGCIVLHDIKQHRYYAFSFDSSPNKPDLYKAISFEGIGYGHDSHCGQDSRCVSTTGSRFLRNARSRQLRGFESRRRRHSKMMFF